MQKSKEKRSLRKLKESISKLRAEITKKTQKDWKDYGVCISCSVYRPIGELQSGHFYSRIHDYTTALLTREENLNLQCVPCNYYKRGNAQGYASGLVRKYGVAILGLLEEAKKTSKRYKYSELEEIERGIKEKLAKLEKL